MNSFKQIFEEHSWEDIKTSIYSKTNRDVENALASKKRTLDIVARLTERTLPPTTPRSGAATRARSRCDRSTPPQPLAYSSA